MLLPLQMLHFAGISNVASCIDFAFVESTSCEKQAEYPAF